MVCIKFDFSGEYGYVREIWIGVREKSGFVLTSLYEPW